MIGLNIELDHFDPENAWAYTIYGAILQAAMTSRRNVLFTTVEEALSRKSDREVGGFILLPADLGLEEIQRAAPDVPVVFMNPPSLSTAADFVSPDYYDMARQIGVAWRLCRKQRAVFLHHPALDQSASGELVSAGLLSGLGDHFNALASFRTLRAENYTNEAGHAAMSRFLKDAPPPDAVFCKGDFLALGAIQALQEAGCDVPGQVSVIGGSGLDLSETAWPQLTRCRQPFQQLGDALFSMLLARIEQKGLSLPGRFIPAPFIGGASTSPAETELLIERGKSAAAGPAIDQAKR